MGKKLMVLALAAVFASFMAWPAFGAVLTSVPLVADGGSPDTAIVVGDVSLVDNNGTITVTYSVDSPWCLKEIHFHVADESPVVNPDDWPLTKKGSPKVGQFATNINLAELFPGECRTDYSFDIMDLGGVFYFAAQAAIEDPTTDIDPDADGIQPLQESAWAMEQGVDADNFNSSEFTQEKNWSTYVEFSFFALP